MRLSSLFALLPTLGAALGALSGTASAAPQFCGSNLEIQPRMGQPIQGLTPAELQRFQDGRQVFNTPLSVGEGLGPIFNDTSCGACHAQPTVGGFSTKTVRRFGKAANGGNPFDPLTSLGGTLLQLQAISAMCQETIPPEADHVIFRLTPSTLGLGLVEGIVDTDITAREMNPPPGVSGFSKLVQPDEGGAMRVAKMGWKADIATVRSFSAGAARNEMGLTNQLIVDEEAPNGDQVLLGQCDTVPDPEDVPDMAGITRVDRFVDFQRFTAPPPQTPKVGMSGETHFVNSGCVACHVTDSYVTAAAPEAALSGVEIKPYSDYLLHDMGALGDGIVSGTATENEMMTRALWGLAFRSAMMHDGRATGGTFADNARAAILAHDGEAAASRDYFDQTLSMAQQDELIEFLQSLGRAEFDFERDNDVDGFDWFFLEQEFTGPGGVVTPDDPGAIADIDVDGDFDLVDFGMLQRAFTDNIP